MMMMGDKKKIASLIMKRFKGSDEYESGKEHNAKQIDKGDSGYSEGYNSAVSEMFDAFEGRDREKFKSSLKHFIQMCLNEQK